MAPRSAYATEWHIRCAGLFDYSPAAVRLLNAGSHTDRLLHADRQANNYQTASATRALTVLKTNPQLAWNTPADIVYGTPLGAAQLNATANVAGTFNYSPAAGAVLNAGSQTLSGSFTPDDAANYNVAPASVTLNVAKAVPTITWPAPADIVYGTALGAAQLNASANVPGTFSYSPAAGTVPGAGAPTLSVTFTPADAATAADVTVTLNVAKARVVNWSTLVTSSAAPLGARAVDAARRPLDLLLILGARC